MFLRVLYLKLTPACQTPEVGPKQFYNYLILSIQPPTFKLYQ
ncbi:13418_t:CDS:1, partial [Gigaspora margarita]